MRPTPLLGLAMIVMLNTTLNLAANLLAREHCSRGLVAPPVVGDIRRGEFTKRGVG